MNFHFRSIVRLSQTPSTKEMEKYESSSALHKVKSQELTNKIPKTALRMRDSIPTIVKYAKAELTPPKPSELKEIGPAIGNIVSSFKTKGYKNLTVKEAWLNTLVAVEVAGWFFVGEIIGRRQLVGYPLKL